jgi:hypothetical protein
MHKLVLTLLVWQVATADKLKARREAGQGTLEYVGMIAVAAIIVVTLIAAASGFDFAGIITKAIDKVKAAAG